MALVDGGRAFVRHILDEGIILLGTSIVRLS